MNEAKEQSIGIAPFSWHKVLIVGGPGSGKSTLGRIVAREIAGPLYELDEIGYVGGAGAERSLQDRLRDVAAIAIEDRWVAEGIYIDWTDALAVAADGIVLLDLPWSVARHRIIMRHVKASLRRSNKHAGLRKLWRFVQDCKRYYIGSEATRLRTASWVDGYKSKAVIFRTPQEVEQFVHSIRS